MSGRHWSKTEENLLVWNWESSTVEALADKLGRTPLSVYCKAHELGLQRGCPQGMEYVTAAAKRTGYALATLKNILRWAKVHVEPTRSRRYASKATANAGFQCHFVRPDAVDAAIASWLSSESVGGAAKARGIRPHDLRARLREHPEAPERPEGRARWRVPTWLIESVLAEKRPDGRRRKTAKMDAVPR